ncbi:MAG: type 2 isopentenyl-diphosphate Delta-isomerase [Polyangiaceae bacterium]|jgi:isopentenyl-diphosphate delta-isomerase
MASRKEDHLALCADGAVGFRQTTTLLECVHLIHDALPDMALGDVDTTLSLLGKPLRAPLLIASMTGGTEKAAGVNRDLARIAEERGYGFGLGSQRTMHARPETTPTFRVRSVAPTALVLGNVGVTQAREMKASDVARLMTDVGADALCLHLNPAMELVQPEGDRDFRDGLATIERVVDGIHMPVVVKETGCGLAPSVGRRIRAVGVRHVDVSGAGGTSWVGVEALRATAAGDEGRRALGDLLWDWGVPTAASIALMAPLQFETIVATGGISTGLDVARAIALGASAAGIARPVLRALSHRGPAGAVAYLERIETELRAVMLLTGCRTLSDLRRTPRIIAGPLEAWMSKLGNPNGLD